MSSSQRLHKAFITSLLLLALGSSPALAEPLQLEIRTRPQGALLKDQFGNELGRGGQTIVLDWSRSKGPLHLQVSHPGYETLNRTLSYRELKEGLYPKEGPLALEPATPWVALRDTARRAALPLGLLVLGSAGVGGAFFRRRRHSTETGDDPTAPSVGRYELLGKVGQGASAIVYRARAMDDPDGLPVALKLLRDAEEPGEHTRERFVREIQAAMKLAHPGLARIYDWGEQEGGTPYLVTELLEGQTLRQKLKEDQRLEPELVARVISALGDSLAYLHGQSLVHRDVKPDNVFLTRKDEVKLVDLGIVQGADLAPMTREGTALGTPHYMAPEQARGKAVPASDQYALAVMAFELLSGQRPYKGSDGLAILQQHAQAAVPAIRDICPDLTPLLESTLQKGMAKTPEARYRDVLEFAEALSQALVHPDDEGLETGAIGDW